jgi:hypothetical protein
MLVDQAASGLQRKARKGVIAVAMATISKEAIQVERK